jgi:hypothetical protein
MTEKELDRHAHRICKMPIRVLLELLEPKHDNQINVQSMIRQVNVGHSIFHACHQNGVNQLTVDIFMITRHTRIYRTLQWGRTMTEIAKIHS